MLRLKNNKTIISAEVNYDCLKALSDGFAVIKILHTRQHTPYDYTLCTYGEIENTNKLDFIAKNSVKSESIFKQILNQFDLSAKEEKERNI